jgi:hypothetical protein
MDAALLIAGALLAVGTPAPLAEQNPLALPGPSSLEREEVQAWTRKYVRGDDWALMAWDYEGVKLAAGGVRKTEEGLAETDIRTELFKPIELSVGVARSGVAHWNVDCAAGRFAVISMTVYAGNNLQGEIARKTTDAKLWQGPVGSEGDTIREVCRAIGLEAKLEPMPEMPPP